MKVKITGIEIQFRFWKWWQITVALILLAMVFLGYGHDVLDWIESAFL